MDQISCMRAFVAVAQEQGFSAAARKLGISKVLVSKYVGQLEDQLGVRLLHRTTRKVSLSTTGEAYLERCASLLEEFEQLQNSVQAIHQKPRGRLRITGPSTFSEMHLLPAISEFSRRYPEVQVELQLADRYVDLVEEGFDMALRIGQLEDSSLIARPLVEMTSYLCASPEYIAQHGMPESPEQLSEHRLISDTNYRSGKYWEFRNPETGSLKTTAISADIYINSARAVRDLLLDGQGIGICPGFAVNQQIADGELIVLLPEWQMPGHQLSAIYPHRRHLSNKVRLFIELLQSGLKHL